MTFAKERLDLMILDALSNLLFYDSVTQTKSEELILVFWCDKGVMQNGNSWKNTWVFWPCRQSSQQVQYGIAFILKL